MTPFTPMSAAALKVGEEEDFRKDRNLEKSPFSFMNSLLLILY